MFRKNKQFYSVFFTIHTMRSINAIVVKIEEIAVATQYHMDRVGLLSPIPTVGLGVVVVLGGDCCGGDVFIYYIYIYN